MFSNYAELGNLGRSKEDIIKACYNTALVHQNTKGLFGWMYRANIWPHPCFPHDKNMRIPLHEGDRIRCAIMEDRQYCSELAYRKKKDTKPKRVKPSHDVPESDSDPPDPPPSSPPIVARGPGLDLCH